MDYDQIRKYWDERASSDSSAQSTTQDYYIREIELRVIRDVITNIKPSRVIDIGCGDARTTLNLASEFPSIKFYGGDYSESMVSNAIANVEAVGAKNISVGNLDITKPLQIGKFDVVYTTRCLINLPTWELQKLAIAHIYQALSPTGKYIMIENFIEGHNNLNSVRVSFDLPPITVRNHNLLFERPKFLEYIASMFDITVDVNISSTYYLVTRVIYSRICQDRSIQPDYFDEHHFYAACLPFSGDYGPVKMFILEKK